MRTMKNLVPLLATVALVACGDPAFRDGQMVQMKVSGSKGMIVYTRCFLRPTCRYTVRFPALQLRTSVKLLGRDGPIEFGTVTLLHRIHEFELEAIPDS